MAFFLLCGSTMVTRNVSGRSVPSVRTAASTRVATAQVQLGSRASQLEDLVNSLEDSKVSLKSGISNKENIDFAEAVINMKTREAAYQAAIQATAKVIQPSLMDFLR